MTTLSSSHQRVIQVAAGLWFFVYFVSLWPDLNELLSNQGFNPEGWSAPYPQVFVGVLVLLSVALMCGRCVQIVAALLWFGWATLFVACPYIRLVSTDYMGWLLAAMVILPHASSLVWKGAWVVAGVTYFVSGWGKLASIYWTSGRAIGLLLDTPLFRDVTWLPSDALLWKIITWSVLGFELLFLPLAVFRKTRPLAWASMTAIHLGSAVMTHLTELSTAMLIFQGFLWDGRWNEKFRRPKRRVVGP